MSIQNDSQPLAIVSGLDALPLISVPMVPLPEGHPDLDTFDTDMAAIAKSARWIWSRALWGQEGQRPDIPDDDLLCDFIPGADVELFLVTDDKVTGLIEADLAEWSRQIAETTERLVAEVFHASI